MVVTGSVITTYNLGDVQSHQDLIADLRSHGFGVEGEQVPGDHARLTVTHEADEAGRLDEHVYAAVPSADIVETVRPDKPVFPKPGRALP